MINAYWGVSPWVSAVWHYLCFLDLGGYFLPQFREFLSYYILKYFLYSILLLSSSETPMIWMLRCLTWSQRSMRLLSLISFYYFFCSASFIYIVPSSTSLILSSASFTLLLVPSRVFSISVLDCLLLLTILYLFWFLVKHFLNLLNLCL